MTQIKLRRDTSANFTSKNPVLGVGEPAYETDTKKLKIGDGTTAYTQLEYFSTGGGGSTNISATLPLKIVDGVISLEVDDQTIQVVDGKLHASNNIFDIGKFTVVGNPTITDDGVASGFSRSNYLTINNIGSLLQNATNWQIEFPIIFANGTITTRQEIFGGTQNSAPYSLLVRLWSDGRIIVAVNGITNTDSFSLKSLNTVSANIKYSIKIKVENNVMYFYLNNILQDSHSITEKVKFSDILRLGVSHQTSDYFKGSTDLKQFSITVDGKEVFNGLMSSTKPIYDAIKANNTELSEFKTETSNDFSAVDSALNEKANLSDLALKQNKLTAGDNITISADNVISSTGGSAPSNMVTTDTAQTITGVKKFTYGDYSFIINQAKGIAGIAPGTNSVNSNNTLQLNNSDVSAWAVGAKSKDGYIYATSLTRNDGNSNQVILDAGNLGSYVDGTTITYTNNKLTASSTAPDKETIMGYIMPDYSTRTEVPWDINNTAPTDGYVEVMGQGDGTTNSFKLIYIINGTETTVSSAYSSASDTKVLLPVICPKGTIYKGIEGAHGHSLHFISMKGAV